MTAVEPEPRLRALAERAARDAPVPVRVVAGSAARLPVPERSVDNAVLRLVLCSIADRRTALVEPTRVLKAGGQVRFLEHTIGTTALMAIAGRRGIASELTGPGQPLLQHRIGS